MLFENFISCQLTKGRRRCIDYSMREVAIRSIACQIEFAFRMEIQALLTEFAVGKHFAKSRGMRKLTGFSLSTIREVFTSFHHGFVYSRHRHGTQYWNEKYCFYIVGFKSIKHLFLFQKYWNWKKIKRTKSLMLIYHISRISKKNCKRL